MMLHDLRHGYWNPSGLTATDCGLIYKKLKGTYQSSKVITLYSQQCAGNEQVLPIDNWVKTFLKWPLDFHESKPNRYYTELFATSTKWGKLERLIWVAAQARKVHSTVCKEILWCVRYGAPKVKNKIYMRGANPLACKICEASIRGDCPSYARIRGWSVGFNKKPSKTPGFRIDTSGAAFESSKATDGKTMDTYSVRDRSSSFKPYPKGGTPPAAT